jgi:hypothetical protein
MCDVHYLLSRGEYIIIFVLHNIILSQRRRRIYILRLRVTGENHTNAAISNCQYLDID